MSERLAVANRVVGYWYNTLGLGHLLMTFGHVSERIKHSNTFLIRGRPAVNDSLINTRTNEIMEVDLNAVKVSGQPGVSMPGETKMHSFIYKYRNDVSAVCHAHPHYCVLASVLGLKLKPICNEGIDLFPVPQYDNNALIATDELGQHVASALGKSVACILRGHGAVTVADTCEVAVIRMMQLEEQARLNFLAFTGMGADYEGIPEDQAAVYMEATWQGLRRAGLPEEQAKAHLGGMNLWSYLASQVS